MSQPNPESYVTHGASDVGQVRTVNQDTCDEFDDPATGRRLLIVADGMGGHLSGDVASRLAVEEIGRVFLAGGDDGGELLHTALQSANAKVHSDAGRNPDFQGMGTTAVCLLFEPEGRAWVGHVGDSRAYRMRGSDFEPLTEDHSVVGALIRMGHITEEEARLHPQRNEILRAIGTNEDVEVQVTPLEARAGDRYLLCSDGLSGLVNDAEIAKVLGEEDPESAVRILIERANLEGGSDNITVQVAIVPGEAEQSALPSAGGTPRQHDTETIPTPLPPRDRNGPPAWVWVAGISLCALLGWLLLTGR